MTKLPKLIMPRQTYWPLLMSGPMVRATLAGLKTETRRTTGLDAVNHSPDDWVVKGCHYANDAGWVTFANRHFPDIEEYRKVLKVPYGCVLDYLWLRENHRFDARHDAKPGRDLMRGEPVWYEADGEAPWAAGRLRPSIHLPRWASRATVQVFEKRVERLHDITEAGAEMEGATRFKHASKITGTYLEGFEHLWRTINGRDSWRANPWVWRIRYKLVEVKK